MKFWSVAALAALTSTITAVPDGFLEEGILEGLSFSTDMVWTPQGQMLVSLKKGEVHVYEDEVGGEPFSYGKMTLALDISAKTCVENERGLGGIQVHPNFEENRFVYLYYATDKFGNCGTDANNGPVNRLSRFVLQEDNTIDPKSEVIFFDTPSLVEDYHNGGRIEFGKDGYLYTSTGDGGSEPDVQDPSNLFGAMIRLTDEGEIPPDNPYASDPDGVRCNATGRADTANGKCQELIALGVRNPFRFAMDPNTSGNKVRFLINNVGASMWESQYEGGDDVVGTAYTFGLPNYGWPTVEGPCSRGKTGGCSESDYDGNFILPYHFYQHQDGGCNSAGVFVPNGIWPSEYNNTYLYGEFVFGQIYMLKDTGEENCYSCSPATSGKEISIFHTQEGVISMRFGPYNGCTQALYYTHMKTGGEMRRIVYVGNEVSVNCVDGNGTVPTVTPGDNSTVNAECLPCSLGIVTNVTDLVTGSPFISEDCGVFAIQQNDGNLVVMNGTPDNPGAEIWDSNGYENATGSGDYFTMIQEDGNLITRGGTPDDFTDIIWNMGYSGAEGKYFFGIDCNLEVVSVYQGTPNNTGPAVWNSAPTPMPVAVPTTSPSLSPTTEPLAAEGGYPGDVFPWNTDCPGDYDFCGMLEFCMAEEGNYGYRLPCVEEDCDCLGISGPLIRLVPGNKYRMTLRNAAPESEITNIHTHGLHIVGAGDGDDVLRKVSGGGNCLDYTWDIAQDHPGGTYWYHAHHHGVTHVQVEGGAFGLLIVEDNTFNDPDLPSWASNERLLQVSVSSVKGTVGNGKTNEVIDIDADQLYRLRVSIVAAYAEPKNFTFDDLGDCIVSKVASDGIWRSSIPRPSASVYELTGASRADFVIRCDTPNSLVPLLYGDDLVATIRVGSSEPNPHVMDKWKPKRPYSLRDLRTLSLPQDKPFDIKLGFDYVNDQKWDPETPLDTIEYDQVHEWTLQQTVRHPFHIHLYHMQVVTPGGCGAHEEGEWYDTISAPGNCTVRFFTADFGQMCVLHCHVLFHEDAGSMSWVDVTGLNMPRNDVQSLEYSCPAIAAPPTASPASDGPTATGGDTSYAAGASRWFSFLVAAVLVQWMLL